MALSQRHRSTIYQQLSPIIGEEETEALLSQFPSRDQDEPVTKEFVHAENADVRAEMVGFKAEVAAEFGAVRTDIAGFKTDVTAEFGAVRTHIAHVRTEVAGLRSEMYDRFRAQTVWIASAMTIGMGLAAGIGRLLG